MSFSSSHFNHQTFSPQKPTSIHEPTQAQSEILPNGSLSPTALLKASLASNPSSTSSAQKPDPPRYAIERASSSDTSTSLSTSLSTSTAPSLSPSVSDLSSGLRLSSLPGPHLPGWNPSMRSPTELIFDPCSPASWASSQSSGARSMIGYFETVLLKPAHHRFLSILNKAEENSREFSLALGISPPSPSSTLVRSSPDPQPDDHLTTTTSRTPQPKRVPSRACPLLSPRQASSPPSVRPPITRRSTVAGVEQDGGRAGVESRSAFYAARARALAAGHELTPPPGPARLDPVRPTRARVITIDGLSAQLVLSTPRFDLTRSALDRFDELEGLERCLKKDWDLDLESVSSGLTSLAPQEGSLQGAEEEIEEAKVRLKPHFKQPDLQWLKKWIETGEVIHGLESRSWE